MLHAYLCNGPGCEPSIKITLLCKSRPKILESLATQNRKARAQQNKEITYCHVVAKPTESYYTLTNNQK